MRNCWNISPADRLSFTELVLAITKVLETLVIYLDFNCSKSEHVLKGSQPLVIYDELSKHCTDTNPTFHVVDTDGNFSPGLPVIIVEDVDGVVS